MKRTILIVDDNEAIRYLLETTFRREYRVATAVNAYTALQTLVSPNAPDLIIANSTLPDAPAWELIDYLRASACYSTVPLIVLSDDTRESTAKRCAAGGVQHFFVKPFNPELLKISVAELVLSRSKVKRRFFRFVS